MSDARSAILGAIRSTLTRRRGGVPDLDAAAIAADAAAFRPRATALRPALIAQTPGDAFLARLTSPVVAATAERVDFMEDFPGVVRRYLAAHALAASVTLQPHPDLLGLDWSGIETHSGIDVDEPVAVGLALGGIAETGSLVFHSGPESPTLLAFLPMHHIVAVRAETIWTDLEEYADVLARLPHPRNVNLVTGASGTTDIEGTLVRGAHGPGHLHVVLIGSPA
jgi:L-lactate dehydrogenase complex protein LldG